MSKFFKALERAKRERLLQEEASRPEKPLTEVLSQPSFHPSREEPAERSALKPEPWFEIPSISRWRDDGGGRKEQRVEKQEEAIPQEVEDHLVSLVMPASFEAEQYRTLRYYVVEDPRREKHNQIVAVTSPALGDGKTTTAINLAGAIAQAPDTRVLLMDTDLRRGSLGAKLGLADGDMPGLIDAMLDSSLSLKDVTRHYAAFNLAVVTLGQNGASPYETASSPRMGELLDEARRDYDYVVLDTPPIVPVPDCRVLEKWVDAFLLVVTAHKTPRKLLEEALNVMDANKVLGMVFNSDGRVLTAYYRPYYSKGGAGQQDSNGSSGQGKKEMRLSRLGLGG